MSQSPWTSENKPAADTQVIVDPTFPSIASKWPGLWIVDSKQPKNVTLRQNVNGKIKKLRINPAYLLPAPTSPTEADAIAELAASPPPRLTAGAVVRSTSDNWKHDGHLFVVMKDNGDKVKLVQLGGDRDRYWPGVPRAWVTEVPLTDVIK